MRENPAAIPADNLILTLEGIINFRMAQRAAAAVAGKLLHFFRNEKGFVIVFCHDSFLHVVPDAVTDTVTA